LFADDRVLVEARRVAHAAEATTPDLGERREHRLDAIDELRSA
jgi:hypothetical protein